MAQVIDFRDSIVRVPMISPVYTLQFPGGDMAKSFGINSAIGLQFMLKTKKNWIFGLSGEYLWGTQVRQSGIVDSITTHDAAAGGFLIANNGKLVDYNLAERGFTTFFKIGKLVPFYGPNQNSGLIIMGGVGFLEHIIQIELVDGTDAITPQLNAQMREGYDRLTNGIAFNEYLGYLFLSNNRMVNFFAGFDFTQGLTKDRRYDYDLMRQDNSLHIDLLYGLRFGWILPLYQRQAREFYTF